LCNEAVLDHGHAAGGNPLDVALWDSPAARPVAGQAGGFRRLATLPFDHERRLVSVLLDDPAKTRLLVTKGAPETLLERCTDVPVSAHEALDAEFAAGNRVVAVATRPASDLGTVTTADEQGLTLAGFLIFLDAPKSSA